MRTSWILLALLPVAPAVAGTAAPPSRSPQEAAASVAERIEAAQKSLEGLRAEIDALKGRVGGTPPAVPPPAPKRTSEETLTLERRLEFLERAIADLGAAVANLGTDLTMRESREAIRRDLQDRVPEVERIQGPAPPASTTPPVQIPRPSAETAAPPVVSGEPMGIPRVAPELPAGAAETGGPDRVILRVGTEEVRKTELDAYFTYLKSYESGADGLLIRDCIDFALVPLAAVRAHYRDRLPKMRESIDKARAEIEGGASFADVARRVSEDRMTAANGGDLGTFGRKEMKLPFARAAFSAEPGKLTGPVETPFGYHLLLVEEATKGATPAEDRVHARHILVSWDPQNANFWNQINTLTDAAVVEVVDPLYQNAVPPRYLRKKE